MGKPNIHTDNGNGADDLQEPSVEMPSGFVWFWRVVIAAFAVAIVIVPEIPAERLAPENPDTGRPMFLIRSWPAAGASHVVLYNVLWAFHGLRSFGFPLRCLFAALVVVSTFIRPKERLEQETEREAERREGELEAAPTIRWVFATILGVICASVFFYALRVPSDVNDTFADSRAIIERFDNAYLFASEPLTFRVYQAALWGIRTATGEDDVRLAIILSVCAAGGLFVFALAIMSRALSGCRSESWFLFLALFISGATAHFFGYVETTGLLLSLLAVYLALAMWILLRGPGRGGWLLWAAALSASGAFLAHAGALAALPSAVVLLSVVEADRRAIENGGKEGSWIGRCVRAGFAWRNLLILGLCVAVPIALVAAVPFYLRGEFGTMGGGGDSIRFVPFAMTGAAAESPRIQYTMFSLLHLLDIASAMMITCPLALPMIGCAAWLRRRFGVGVDGVDGLEGVERAANAVFGAAAAGCATIPLLWNHDFGMWGDWNIASAYFFPLHATSWLLLFLALKRLGYARGFTARFGPAMLGLQLLMALGILLQLY